MPPRMYCFPVPGLPPKKGSATSMWSVDLEARRVRELRLAATKAIGDDPPLRRSITLRMWVYVHENTKQVGDLDTFVAGVCDGLMAAPAEAPLAPVLNDLGEGRANPARKLAIEDDFEVVRIEAEKIVDPETVPRFEIELWGE